MDFSPGRGRIIESRGGSFAEACPEGKGGRRMMHCPSCGGTGRFLLGMTTGLVTGAVIGAAMAPGHREMRRAAHKAAKKVNEAVDNLTDAMGF